LHCGTAPNELRLQPIDRLLAYSGLLDRLDYRNIRMRPQGLDFINQFMI
jgi:hypothetical protein